MWDKDNIDHWESGKFPASERRVLVTHLLSMAWKKVISPDNQAALLRYFTKTGCAVTANGEDDELICPQPFKEGEFTLEDGPGQVQPPLASGDDDVEPDEPDDDMEEDLYDGIIDYMAVSQAKRSARIIVLEQGDEVGGKPDDDEEAYRLFDALEPGREGGKYKHAPLPDGGAEDVQIGDTIVKLFTTGWERGKVVDTKKASPSQKREAKEFSVPRLVQYVLDKSYWIHDLGDEKATYLSEEQFKNLDSGASIEANEGIKVGTWCLLRHVPAEFDSDDKEERESGDDDEDDDESDNDE